ncbi:MAG: ATP-binding cassette domain-containing protein [Lachnospiraceae bacterium]
MIEIEHLTKKFGETTVLDDISMTLKPAHIYGLVGRNGSGKTMLMKHILGFVHATSGSIKVDGKEIGKDIDMPQNVGAIIENPGFLPEYSGFKNLKLLAMIKGQISDEEIKDAIRFVGLDPENKKHVGKYSLGMRQRLGLAQALMEHPNILLLDEPLSGLDNDGVKEMHQLLLKQKEQGRLLLVASHSKEDINVLCDEIFYFDKGKMIDHVLVNE